MQRVLLALVVGAVVGGAAVYVAIGTHTVPAPETGAAAAARLPAAEPRARQVSPAASATAERAALYGAAAGADGTELARLIAAAAALPPSPSRTDELRVLLARYAELDPARAVESARELGSSVDTLAALYAQWAAADRAGALAALANVESPAAANALGLAMLPALGGDEYALQQVLAALPDVAESALRIGALEQAAAGDPAAALDRALELEDFGAESLAVERIGAAWARLDPRAALERAQSIDQDELRVPFQSAVLRTWAQTDANGLLEYSLGLDLATQQRLGITSGLFDVARLDPERMLAAAARLPTSMRNSIERMALDALARRSPEAALERMRTLPQGQQLQIARQAVARAYGKKDPEAALAWARTSGEREAMIGVVSGIAAVDPNRALDLAATLPAQDRSSAYMTIVSGAASDREVDLAALAERLLSATDRTAAANGVTQLLQVWESRAPDAAIDWVMANAARVPPSAFQAAGRLLAQNDTAAAERRLAQLPSEARGAWLQGMAQGYVQTDPAAGAAWVEHLRGDPAFPLVASTIAQGLASTDPPAAAALLDGVPRQVPGVSQMAMAASINVATSWARTNPLAAAEWVRGFAADERSTQALGAVTQVWAGGDYGAARTWTLGLPSGAARDAALRPLLTAAGNGLDTSLLTAFSADLPRQQALLTAVAQLATRDPSEARAVADRYITRPEIRAQADRLLEQRGLIPGIARPMGVPTF